SKSGTWLSMLPVACTLTTAGPYLSTSWVKSGSSAAATVALDATTNNTATNQRERGCVMKSLLVVESRPARLTRRWRGAAAQPGSHAFDAADAALVPFRACLRAQPSDDFQPVNAVARPA